MALKALIEGFRDEVFDKVDRVHRESFKETVLEANDENVRMPVDTGALQNSVSVRAATDGDGVGLVGKDNIALAVDSAPKFASYRASWGNEEVFYAAFQEFGTEKITPRAFVRFALENWESKVAKNTQPDP